MNARDQRQRVRERIERLVNTAQQRKAHGDFLTPQKHLAGLSLSDVLWHAVDDAIDDLVRSVQEETHVHR